LLECTPFAIRTKAVVAKLIDGKKWRANAMTLPGLLNVLQVDAGSGFVDVGATNANKGVNVASIYQHPAVHTNRDADNKEVWLCTVHSYACITCTTTTPKTAMNVFALPLSH
jgi:hypothetical protein